MADWPTLATANTERKIQPVAFGNQEGLITHETASSDLGRQERTFLNLSAEEKGLDRS